MRDITEKQLNKNEKILLDLYKNAYQEIYNNLLKTLDYDRNPNFSDVSIYSMMKQIEYILEGLNVDIKAVVPQMIVDSVEYGYKTSVDAYFVGMGLTGVALDQAIRDFPFSSLGKEMAERLAKDTMKDLLAVTNNTEYTVKKLIREAFNKHMATQNLLNKDFHAMAAVIKKELTGTGLKVFVKDGIIAIVDKAGRRWKLDTYIDMAVKTKFHQAKINGMKEYTKNTGECDLAVIPRNGALDDCNLYEGMIISLTGATDGFKSFDDLQASNRIFHPRCRHYPAPIRGLDNLPKEDVAYHYEVSGEMEE